MKGLCFWRRAARRARLLDYLDYLAAADGPALALDVPRPLQV